MGYEHYGKWADVWKHLCLCTALSLERPAEYVDGYSASAWYVLTKTDEQRHGIYTFLDGARAFPDLAESPYYQIEYHGMHDTPGDRYFGSPALAMQLLRGIASRFTFFDTDLVALQSVDEYAEKTVPGTEVRCLNEDSVMGLYDLIPSLDSRALVFLDPYDFIDPFGPGDDALGAFLEARRNNIAALAWYGFDSFEESAHVIETFKRRVGRRQSGMAADITLYLETIDGAKYAKNPGVMGCGMLGTHLHSGTIKRLEVLGRELCKLYEGTRLYDAFSGALAMKVRTFP